MIDAQSPDERAAETGGVPATPEPWEGSVHVEAVVVKTVQWGRKHCIQDELGAKGVAETLVGVALTRMGYEVLDIKSTVGE
jgi:hypothetical protein